MTEKKHNPIKELEDAMASLTAKTEECAKLIEEKASIEKQLVEKADALAALKTANDAALSELSAAKESANKLTADLAAVTKAKAEADAKADGLEKKLAMHPGFIDVRGQEPIPATVPDSNKKSFEDLVRDNRAKGMKGNDAIRAAIQADPDSFVAWKAKGGSINL